MMEQTVMDQDILQEQIAYYRARAQEYDESVGWSGELEGAFASAERLLRGMGPFERVAELASGTGIWTQLLLEIGHEITAIDSAPEMLALARHKLGDARVQYQQANLFEWEPVQTYDLVFFASWVSHIPPDRLDNFLDRACRAVRPGGQIVIIDEHTPTLEDRQIIKDGAQGPIYAERPLRNGQTFTIVKVFYDEATLGDRLTALGFEVTIHRLDDIFFFISARRQLLLPSE